ncbi:hypothetical protein [Paenibacillus kobensis]|uniref:hypothetical protein n=1 Tax=Paenibacillus kobensis TaxID=59841 RepID=UPI000FD7A992|nr:hypothetical protein [Paenibacillus kobensis]
MSYYNEEFYYAPNEFEQQVDEFKTALLNSVRDEFKAEMEQLRTENAELQEVRKNIDKMRHEHQTKLNELNNIKNDAMRIVRKERLSELMKDLQVVMYRATTDYPLPPKCDKCNEKRKIVFFSPSGQELFEHCKCASGKSVYMPEEYVACEFSMDSYNANKVKVWYKLKPSSSSNRNDDYGSYDSSTYRESIYNDKMSYADLDKYKTFFKTIEECQKYCDWLNENKAG